MQLAASHQAAGDVRRLQRRAFGRRVGGEISGDRDEDVPALVGVAPNGELPDPRLQHLVRMEAGIFPQHRPRERGDQRLGRMALRQVPRHEPCRKINLSLAVKRVEQRGADRLLVRRQFVESLAALARDAGRRHIEVASELEGHCSVSQSACSLALPKRATRSAAP
jgi:hypothetical protein